MSNTTVTKTMNVSRTFVFLFIFCLFYTCECKYGYVVWSDNKPVAKVSDYFADIPDAHVARATYSNEINTTGFVDFLFKTFVLRLISCSDCLVSGKYLQLV